METRQDDDIEREDEEDGQISIEDEEDVYCRERQNVLLVERERGGEEYVQGRERR